MLSVRMPQPASAGSLFDGLELIRKGGPDALDVESGEPSPDGLSGYTARRTRIWELGGSLHCSIIGTCLTTAELRHILAKLKLGDASSAADHELHTLGVALAGRREGGAKFLQKALDRRHRVAVTRYSRAQDPTALLPLWEDSLKQGAFQAPIGLC